jgi:hypothetical protein
MTRFSRIGFTSAAAVARARCLGVLVAVASIVLSSRAFAAAPICDPSGASAVAPTPAPPNATGELVAPKSCDDVDAALVLADSSKPAQDSSSAPRVTPAAPRVLPIDYAFPEAPGARQPVADVAPTVKRSAFADPVYRPPRA